MAGAYKCASVPGSRQWLECYYGAAQPQRAHLGLAPVLPGQAALAASPPAGSAIADPEVRAHVMVAASQCYAIPDDRQWLDCYYGAATPIRSALGLQTAQSNSGPKINTAAVRAPPRSTSSSRISARVQSFSFDRSRNFTITLANGQVWRQIQGDTNYAHWDEPPGNYIANIKPGFLGSFNLQIKGKPQVFKVQQVQ